VAVQDVRTPATAVVAGSASAVRHADGRPSNWSGGRLVSRRRCPRDRGDPGCPDRHASGVHSRCSRAVRTVLDPGIRRCGGTGHIGAPGWTCRCGRCAAWSSLPESGLAGRDGRTLAVRGSHEGRPQTWTATWYAYRLRRRPRCSATMGVGPAPVPVGWRGEQGKERMLQVPHRCGLGRLPTYRPTWGWTGGGDHPAWSGALVLAPFVPPWRPYPAQRRVDRGRSAAAVCQERCPLGTDSALTSQNSGGRDRGRSTGRAHPRICSGRMTRMKFSAPTGSNVMGSST
jgi:hypothetical protein